MNQSAELDFKTAGLVIRTATGEVFKQQTTQQTPVRLSPVNKRVLLTLLQNAGQVVSRQQLFDSVWPNQVVSDDALTRCISDLRAQLRPLTEVEKLIETIPKTGYRWLPPLQSKSKHHGNKKPTKWAMAKPIIMGFVLSLVMLWVLTGLFIWWNKPTVVSMVILPTESHLTHANITHDVDEILKQSTQQHKDLQYLSAYAFDAHKGNPFPYFSHEFGVRWFVESQVLSQSEGETLTLNLIDARTALVIYSTSAKINNEEDILVTCDAFMQFIAGL